LRYKRRSNTLRVPRTDLAICVREADRNAAPQREQQLCDR
jgi:hypothetical protein